MANDIPQDKSDIDNPSQYIRTYAKDMAALAASNGTPPDKKAVSVPAPTHGRVESTPTKVPQTEKQKAKKSDVVFSETGEGDFFQKSVPKAEQGDTYQEPISLPSVEEAGSILESRPTQEIYTPAHPTEIPPPIPLMPKRAQEPVAAAPTASPEVQRESVLARLRARMSRDAQMEMQTPHASEATSYREPIPESETMPELPPEPSPIPPSEPEPVPAYVPEPIPELIAPAEPPQPEPQPGPVIPEPVPAPAPVPVFEQIVESAPPIPAPSQYREPIEEPASPAPFIPPPSFASTPESEIPSRFHTYTTDFADHIDDDHASTFSVLAAQADAGRVTPAPAKQKRSVPWIPIVAGVVLILAGGTGLVYAAQYFSKIHTVPATAPTAPSLIFVDSRIELKGTGPALINALAQQATQPLGSGRVLLTYITVSTTTAKGISSFVPTSGGALIAALQLQAPDILLRNVDQSSTVGVVQAGNQEGPFFILHVSSYERTLAGMLTWEPTMWSVLSTLYPLYPASTPITQQTIGTTTGTSPQSASSTIFAQPIPAVASARAIFDDEVVASHDARVLRDTNGNTLLIYGYYDKQTLIIARDESAFTELINRLSATKVQ